MRLGALLLVSLGAGLVAAIAACSSSSSSSPSGPTTTVDAGGDAGPSTLRVGQFNLKELATDKLVTDSNLQVDSAAEIIGRFAPDFVNINEIQFDLANTPKTGLPGAPTSTKPPSFDHGAQNAQRLADRIAAKSGVTYSEIIHFFGNSGTYWKGENPSNSDSFTLRGWGEWPGRFNTAILSKHPILKDEARVINDFHWSDLPDNMLAQMKKDTGLELPTGFPLFEKSLNLVPIDVHGQKIWLVLLHPTAPVYDPINKYRNHDELHALQLFLERKLPGVDPLPDGAKFIVIGDFNADPDGDGDGVPGAIAQIIDLPSLNARPFPTGAGNAGKAPTENTYLGGCGDTDGGLPADPSKSLQLHLDYILPSVTTGSIAGGAVFLPERGSPDFPLACHASDHMFTYVDIKM